MLLISQIWFGLNTNVVTKSDTTSSLLMQDWCMTNHTPQLTPHTQSPNPPSPKHKSYTHLIHVSSLLLLICVLTKNLVCEKENLITVLTEEICGVCVFVWSGLQKEQMSHLLLAALALS